MDMSFPSPAAWADAVELSEGYARLRTIQHHLHIVTGGPGSGKTALVEALAATGVSTMPEAGRAVIREQSAIGGNALPWADRSAFAESMHGRDLISFYNATARPGRVVLDRGIPDVIGYLTLCGLPVPGHLRFSAETCRYNAHVFIAPHWPDIFAQDAERRQSAQEAEATYHVMAETYASLGYTLVPLPLAPVEERVRFVLETLLRQ